MKNTIYVILISLVMLSCGDDDSNEGLLTTTGYDIELLRSSNVIYQFGGNNPRYLGKFRSGRTGIDKYIFELSTGDDPNSLMVVNFYLEDDVNLFESSDSYPLAFIDNITLNEIPRFGPVAEVYFENTDGFPNGPGPTSVATSGELTVTINAPLAELVIDFDGFIDDNTPLEHEMSGSVIFLESPEQ